MDGRYPIVKMKNGDCIRQFLMVMIFDRALSFVLMVVVGMINRKKVVCFITGLVTCGPAYADQRMDDTSNSSQPIKGTLRNYCILPEECTKVDPPSDMPDCGIRPTTPSKYPCVKEIRLKRPNSKCCVAIVRVELDGKIVLNPKGFSYGPIPDLPHMTKSQADELWGTEDGKVIAGDVVTYKLLSYGMPHDTYLDVVFSSDKLKKYRIRSSQLTSTDWHQIQ